MLNKTNISIFIFVMCGWKQICTYYNDFYSYNQTDLAVTPNQ